MGDEVITEPAPNICTVSLPAGDYYYIDFTAESSKFTQNGRAIFDTGSPTTVISVYDLNAEFRQHLTPSRMVRING
ncbi:MAG: hypothetical protein CMO47_00660, partial [Verrucomicrobiales bacterium]|nr:hypothetical protein [Verrucomicrobiales bacterium]